jgi:histidyl-tRNA synthetase
LRRSGVATEAFTRGNFKKQMARASASGARFAVIAGVEGVGDGQAMLKDLVSGVQRPVAVAELAAEIAAA